MLLNDLIDAGWTIRRWPDGCLELNYRDTGFSVVGPYLEMVTDRPNARHCFLVSAALASRSFLAKSFGPALSKNGRWVHFTDEELILLKLAGDT